MLCVIYRMDRENIGDWHSCPADYFDLGEHRRQDIYETPNVADCDAIVLGGGGLFHSSFEDQLEAIVATGKPIIVWSAGTNYHYEQARRYSVDLSKMKLVGLRDSGPDCVPCVSCMSELLVPKPGYGVVVYAHKDQPELQGLGLPWLSNSCTSLAKVVEHLNFGDTVITNTYHGWLWSVLLGKRVILYKPFSNKFYHLPFPVPTAASVEDVVRLVASDLPVYPNALETCRDANRRFYEKVIR